jgi:hypothetical protein
MHATGLHCVAPWLTCSGSACNDRKKYMLHNTCLNLLLHYCYHVPACRLG